MRSKGTRTRVATAGAMVCALIATGAASASGSVAAPRQAATQKLTTLHFTGLRNFRYCEIFLINQTSSGVSVRVSNTTGVDPCGNKEWKALNPKTVAKNRGVDAVFKNGQRWWVLDQVVVRGVNPKVQTFGHVQARDWGGFTSAGARPPAYGEQTISRDTQWWYRSGRIIYQLIAPDGKYYVMQAYSRIVDKNMKMSDLMSLGSRLHLPTGWEYQISILDSNLSLPTVDKKATIIQDEFQNTYMLLTDSHGNPIPVP